MIKAVCVITNISDFYCMTEFKFVSSSASFSKTCHNHSSCKNDSFEKLHVPSTFYSVLQFPGTSRATMASQNICSAISAENVLI